MAGSPRRNGLQDEWHVRQQRLGDAPRAVLMKGVPDRVNATIDRWHRDVLRFAFAQWSGLAGPLLDIGCGYGRLGAEAKQLGAETVVGLDFSPGFCRRFAERHGWAVRGDLQNLPFATDTFSGAYAVTSLMYLDASSARDALRALDDRIQPGGRILLLEPGAEFTRVTRSILRRKAADALARTGFEVMEFRNLAPARWRPIASGSNDAMTFLFPLLLLTARFPRLHSAIERLVLHVDRPRAAGRRRRGRYAIYRWALYETPAAHQPDRLRNTQM
jgi:SAM-dependent methyltransferase